MKLSSLIVESMNEPTVVTQWRHEGGCEEITTGLNYQNIEDLTNLKFLLIIVERLTQLDNGRMQKDGR